MDAQATASTSTTPVLSHLPSSVSLSPKVMVSPPRRAVPAFVQLLLSFRIV